MEARHIFTDYYHSWGYFQISFGDELKFKCSVHAPVTRLITGTFTFECRPWSQGDLQRSFTRRLEELNYTLKSHVNMLKVRSSRAAHSSIRILQPCRHVSV